METENGMQRYWVRAMRWLWPALVGVCLAVVYVQQQKIEQAAQQIGALSEAISSLAAREPPSVIVHENEQRPGYAEAVERAMPSVVNIYTKKLVRTAPLVEHPLLQRLLERNLPQQERVLGSLGSGVIVRQDGYVMTNLHVIDGATEIVISLHDGRDAPAKLIGIDRETDLALLKIDMDELAAMPFADPQRARIGDVVLAIGNPFGVGQTVTQGIISAAARYGLELNIQENYLQTDAAINQGNSGGALVDSTGGLLGINTAIQSPTGGSVGIGYAIPSDTVAKVLADLIEHGKVVRGWIGIEWQALPAYYAASLGLVSEQGLVIRAIYRAGPADLAGLQLGDVITHFDGAPALSTRAGMRLIATSKPGQKIAVRLLRAKQKIDTELTVGVRPNN